MDMEKSGITPAEEFLELLYAVLRVMKFCPS